jgi:hypothetical protein
MAGPKTSGKLENIGQARKHRAGSTTSGKIDIN